MVGALACITLWHIIKVFFSFWMLSAGWAPTNLAAIQEGGINVAFVRQVSTPFFIIGILRVRYIDINESSNLNPPI